MSTKIEVRKASEQFYTALNRMLNGDASSLSEIWSHSAAVTNMHPTGRREVGWENVKTAVEQIAKLSSQGQVELKDQLIQVAGDMPYEVGTEQGQTKLRGLQVSIDHRVTNIYRKEAGAWKIVHHHTYSSPTVLDVLCRLQSEA